ncbi:glycosyltransferase family 9 protein [Gluconobacter kondonii]|uniref:glycosyltransferase family 9 protein n=1 Tax=Gluconobacter kondonii TaxID=941463 RepID=UPI001B8B3B8B|nr:glycosyltransferase family 9 protein [Gluconobacter kondonii]MBS1084497.1 hypothetical protein [Gluconobacter kondonii]
MCLVFQHLNGLLHALTPAYGAAERERHARIRVEGFPFLAVTVVGGVGDLLVTARFLRDMTAAVGPFSFDVFCAQPKLSDWIFSGISGFRESRFDAMAHIGSVGSAYDAHLKINQTVTVLEGSVKSAMFRQNSALLTTLKTIEDSARKLKVYVDNQPRLDNGIGHVAVYSNASRCDFLHHMAAIPYGGDAYDIPADSDVIDRFSLKGKQWITVHNGFDTQFVVSGERATKCYPHFAAIIAQMKQARPDLLIVQIGTSNSEKLAGVDYDLIGKTTLREVGALLRGATLHLDNESGLVHLAACLGTRSVVVFGPTPADYFGYRTNVNITPIHCGGCWWIDDLWMDRCPRKLSVPECTYTLPPADVATKALDALAEMEAT